MSAHVSRKLSNCKKSETSRRSQIMGQEQHGKEREAGDKGTGSGRAGYGRREVLTPLSLSIDSPVCDMRKNHTVELDLL